MSPRKLDWEAASRSAARQGVSLLVLIMTYLAVGCSGGETIWSTEVKSPDAQWTAVGRTDRYSGPGNAAIFTGVYLRRAQDSKDEEPVLRFSDDQSPADARVSPAMEWLTPGHLQISLGRHVEIDLQVVKYAGIEISVSEPFADELAPRQVSCQ